MNKKVVLYKDVQLFGIGIGALVFPIDHPDTDRVSNSTWARTSPVIDVRDDEFETLNTIYKKAQ